MEHGDWKLAAKIRRKGIRRGVEYAAAKMRALSARFMFADGVGGREGYPRPRPLKERRRYHNRIAASAYWEALEDLGNWD